MKVLTLKMAILLAVLGACGQQLHAGVIWDGDGAAASDWGTATNWDSDTLPAFDGTDDINISQVNALGTSMTLGANRDINSLTSNESTPNWTLAAGNTLTLQSGEIRKANQARVTIEANIALAADGRFRSDNASNSGMFINGVVSDSGGARNVVAESTVGNLTLSGASTYTGNTTVRRGTLTLGADLTSGSPGPFGTSTGAILVGDATTGSNNWDTTLNITGRTIDRDITFVNTGSAGFAQLTTNSSGTSASGTLTLNRDILLRYGGGGSLGTYSGQITGTGGFDKVGGVETMILSNTTNNFTGQVQITDGSIRFSTSGTANALGGTSNTSDLVFNTGETVNRGIYGVGTGTFSRDIIVNGSSAVRISSISTASGTTTYTGNIAMNDLAAVSLGASTGQTTIFDGILSGTSDVFLPSASSSSSSVHFNNAANSFTGTLRVGSSRLFVGANAPSGANGALGNATSAVELASLSSGVNPGGIFTTGAFTIGRDITIKDLGTQTGHMVIGGSTAHDSSYTGNITIEDRSTVNNYFNAATGGSVTFTGVIAGTGTAGLRTTDGNAPFSNGGDVIFGGVSANTYPGLTEILSGTRLVAAKNSSLGSTALGTTVSNGGTLGFQGGINYAAAEAVSIVGTGLSGQGAINNISGDNTFAGDITTTGSSTLGASADSLRLSGNLSGGNALTTAGSGTIFLDGTVTATSVSVGSGSTLGGTGTISGTLLGAGTVDPGNSPGILTAAQVNPASGIDFDFEVTQVNPNYGSPSASGNDLLRLTDGIPFSSALGGTNDVNVYFNFDFMAGKNGDYQVGFYTDNTAAFDSSLALANISFLVRENGGPITYDGQQYEDFAVAFPSALATWTTVNPDGLQFGSIDGFVFQVTLSGLPEVPEPSTVTLLGLGLFGLIARGRRRRRQG